MKLGPDNSGFWALMIALVVSVVDLVGFDLKMWARRKPAAGQSLLGGTTTNQALAADLLRLRNDKSYHPRDIPLFQVTQSASAEQAGETDLPRYTPTVVLLHPPTIRSTVSPPPPARVAGHAGSSEQSGVLREFLGLAARVKKFAQGD
ncbi:hypothetical protein PENSTE_c034G06260 [Penicillium steckii]|uniref:Uncharacterized protein n=1 Tax=Penicillium steckii TaxID=303698 RepID=A0A1V6SKN8_9EURO|nr:hypothetical protein PENSTE_c034G06260 [Penicillium steckii]